MWYCLSPRARLCVSRLPFHLVAGDDERWEGQEEALPGVCVHGHPRSMLSVSSPLNPHLLQHVQAMRQTVRQPLKLPADPPERQWIFGALLEVAFLRSSPPWKTPTTPNARASEEPGVTAERTLKTEVIVALVPQRLRLPAKHLLVPIT